MHRTTKTFHFAITTPPLCHFHLRAWTGLDFSVWRGNQGLCLQLNAQGLTASPSVRSERGFKIQFLISSSILQRDTKSGVRSRHSGSRQMSLPLQVGFLQRKGRAGRQWKMPGIRCSTYPEDHCKDSSSPSPLKNHHSVTEPKRPCWDQLYWFCSSFTWRM